MQQLSLLDDDPDPAERATGSGTARGIEPARQDAELAALATSLSGRLRLGTSSWSFPGWSGLVYACSAPKQSLSRDGLAAYARHPLLRSVGVDSGFYAPLDARRLARYAGQVPAGFRFLVKAPASITDPVQRGAGSGSLAANPGFLDPALALQQAVHPYLEGLGDKAGVLLFQFPPLGRAWTRQPRRFAEDLYRFLHRLPLGPAYAVELRDPQLLTPDLAAALHHGGAVPGLAGHPRLPPVGTQQDLFAEHDDGPLVIRWLLRRNRGYGEARDRYQPFDRLCEPDPETRTGVATLVRAALARGREVYVIANNKAEGSSPLTLIELARELAGNERDRRRLDTDSKPIDPVPKTD